MSEQTKQTGATNAQIEAAAQVLDQRIDWDAYSASEGDSLSLMCARAVLSAVCPADQCIVPRSFVDAAKAVLNAYDAGDGRVDANQGTVPLGPMAELEYEIGELPEGLR